MKNITQLVTSYDPHPVCSTPFIGLKRGVRVISEAVRAIYGGHMTISDTHETEAPNLYGKITHTYGVVVRGYEVNIPVIPTFWIGRPLSPPTLKETFSLWLHIFVSFLCSKKLSEFVQILYFVLNKDGHLAGNIF